MKRDHQLDVLRGLCLVIMASDHIGGPISKLTLEPLGFFSAAEGFIFISGLVVGMVYTKRSEIAPPGALYRLALSRAWTFYLYHASLLLVVLLFVLALPEIAQPWKEARYATGFFENPLRAVWLGLTFLYQPTFMNILPLYCVVILLTPPAIDLFRRGKAVTVLAASAGLWAACQFGFNDLVFDLTFNQLLTPRMGALSIMAWQTIYFLGLWLGYKRRRGERVVSMPSLPTIRWLALVALVLAGLRHGLRLIRKLQRTGSESLSDFESLLPSPALNSFIDNLIHNKNLGPLRLLNFLLVVYLITYALERYEARRSEPANHARWLAFLGRHSLQVWAYHVLAVYAVFLIQHHLVPESGVAAGFVLSLLSLTVLASLTVPAKIHQLYQARHRAALLHGPTADRRSSRQPPGA